MAEAYLLITEGTGAKLDFRTVGTVPDRHRQVLVIGDPVTDTAVAPVTAAYGLYADVRRVPADPFGAKADAAVGDASGTINAHARGIAKVLGTNADAALTAGAAGSIDALLRSISRDLVGTLFGIAGLNSAKLYNDTIALTPKFAKIDRATNADGAAVVNLVVAKKIRVIRLTLIAAGTVGYKWQSATSNSSGAGSNTDLMPVASLVANSGVSDAFSPVGLFETVAGEGLKLNLNAAVQVSGYLTYIEV